MPLYDVNYVLMNAVTVSTSTNGPDVSVIQGGAMEGLQVGLIVQAMLRCSDANPGENAAGGDDNLLDIYLQESTDGTNFRDLAKFPQLGSTADPNLGFASNGKAVMCFFVPSFNATKIRWRSVQAGTEHTWTGVTVTLHPTNHGPVI